MAEVRLEDVLRRQALWNAHTRVYLGPSTKAGNLKLRLPA